MSLDKAEENPAQPLPAVESPHILCCEHLPGRGSYCCGSDDKRHHGLGWLEDLWLLLHTFKWSPTTLTTNSCLVPLPHSAPRHSQFAPGGLHTPQEATLQSSWLLFSTKLSSSPANKLVFKNCVSCEDADGHICIKQLLNYHSN